MIGIEISHNEHQEIMLRLLKDFDDYCNQNNLRYFLSGGTLLGAVRHKGFIPWDDDVDVVMPRPDYEKLIQNKKISEGVEVVSNKNDCGYYHPFVHTNIVDSGTIMKEKQVKRQTNKGVFIDIFPLDGIPDSSIKQKLLTMKLCFLESLLSIKISVSPGFSTFKNTCKTILGYVTFFINEKKLSLYIDKIASANEFDKSKQVAQLVALFGKPQKLIYPIEDFSDYILLDFENNQFRCAVGYRNFLTTFYGDYMSLPPESERHGQHGITIYRRKNKTEIG